MGIPSNIIESIGNTPIVPLRKVVPPGSSSADLQVGTSSEGRAAGQQ